MVDTFFLDRFLKDTDKTAALPPGPGGRDVLTLDPQFFSATPDDDNATHRGACGNICATCTSRSPGCAEHDHADIKKP